MASSYVEIAQADGTTEALSLNSVRQTAVKPALQRPLLSSIWGVKAIGWFLLAATLIVAALVAMRSPVFSTEAGARTIQMEEIVAQGPKQTCSKVWTGDSADDCSQTKCCRVSGYSCYEKWPGLSGCLDSCDPRDGWTCKMPRATVPLVEVSGHAGLAAPLYCISVYTNDTGSTKKKSHELELLQLQYQKKLSIFSCDYYDVFSDVVAQVGPGYPTIKVDDVAHEFHVVKRKKVGTWVNTGMFKQIWKAMSGKIGLQKADWVVKVDADAVFVPHRLKAALMGQPLTYTGIYFENCQGVEWGFFGNLEVYSMQAFKTLLANIDSCSEKIDWVKGTKWGPIGEDLFAQMCMDNQGVTKLQNFDLTTDALCPGTKKRWGQKDNKKWKPPCAWVSTPSLHPFKKVQEWMSCHDATIALG